jgi:hypothetical protein
VIIGALLLLGLASVPLAGGRLSALADLRLRLVGVAVGAFAVQIVVVNVLPGGSHALHSGIHVATYAVLGVVVAANLRVPGLPLVALGGLSNAIAIAANGGVMPARAAALRLAGMDPDPAGFTNSALVAHPHLWFLGDVFAVPAWVPAANVFSVGDLLLVAGAWVLLHRVCREPRAFALTSFEQVSASSRSVLLRLRASGAEGLELLVYDGHLMHRLAPLPGGGDVLGFAAPTAWLAAGRPRFAAALGTTVVDLPAPRPVTIP